MNLKASQFRHGLFGKDVSVEPYYTQNHREALRSGSENMHSTHVRSWSAFLMECALSRRRFLRGAAGTAASLFGAGLLSPSRVWADQACVLPNPIPGTLPANLLGPGIPPFPIHEAIGLADQGAEGTNITDFIGDIGDAVGGGSGTDSEGNSLTISVANFKFTKGVYRGVDGNFHRGAFAFI
jgi:hypothetical protein